MAKKRSGKEQWMIGKWADEAVNALAQPTKTEPEFVPTGRTLTEMSEEKPPTSCNE